MKIALIHRLVLILLLVMATGCGNRISDEEKAAAAYVQDHGYSIVASKGLIGTYLLDRSKLAGTTEMLPYRQTWSVQQVEPDRYFGKEIVVYGFTVSGHPLEKRYGSKIDVTVLMSEGKPIGGTSFPAPLNGYIYMGAPDSLDGRTMEEITGMTYAQFLEEWKSKYAS